MPNEDDERYRWCIWCQADCWLEPENQTHQPDCPRITGMYPVKDGQACCECGARLEGHCRFIELGPLTFEVVCDACAIAAWLGAE